MVCPACETVNPEGTQRCRACGDVLLRPPRRPLSGRVVVLIAVLVVVSIAALVATQCDSSYHP